MTSLRTFKGSGAFRASDLPAQLRKGYPALRRPVAGNNPRPCVQACQAVFCARKPQELFLCRRRNLTIARRPHNAPPSRETGPRVNERIRAPEIRLIGADGENVGVVTPARAMVLAEEAGLDLVEISPNATPPVCKIMDFGKFKYESQKRESEARKKQKIIEIKEIKFRPGTDTHDYDVKMRSVLKFLGEGDKVKVTLRFRGREMAHQQLGLELLNRVAADVDEVGKVENMPKLEGRQMVMMIGPR